MEEGRSSFTAVTSAMLRAAHLLWDDPPKIFKDTFALRLSGCESEAVLRAVLNQVDGGNCAGQQSRVRSGGASSYYGYVSHAKPPC